MISSYPPIVDHFRAVGTPAEHCRLGFDERILERLAEVQPRYDVTFIGGFAPSHPNRPPWLEGLLDKIDIDIFGYGLSRVRPDSPIHAHHHGPVWGWRMFEVLRQSRITLNSHAIIDIRGKVVTRFANNMRLYEATGVGTCLVTEQKANLADMFEPGREVVAYDGESDCVEKVRYYLSHEPERAAIALAGQQRTLDEHTYTKRMEDLLDLLRRRL